MVLGAHAFGLSHEVGAFLAGMSLAQLPYNENLRMRVHPLMNFFIAVFFVTLGVRIDFDGALGQLGATAALAAFVVAQGVAAALSVARGSAVQWAAIAFLALLATSSGMVGAMVSLRRGSSGRSGGRSDS